MSIRLFKTAKSHSSFSYVIIVLLALAVASRFKDFEVHYYGHNRPVLLGKI